MVDAADLCPAPPKYQVPLASDIAADDHRIHIESDDALLDADGNAILNGRVKVRQDARSVTSDSVTYDDKTGRVAVKGGVDFEDPKLRVRSVTGSYDIDGAANFDQANFQLMDRNGRGLREGHSMCSRTAKSTLAQVRYTSCPVGNEDWMLQASSISLDTKHPGGRRAQRNHALQGRADFLHSLYFVSLGRGPQERAAVPELWPFRQQRLRARGSLLFQSGAELRPHAHARACCRPAACSLAEQFRYLTARSRGQIDATFLPDDSKAHNDRSYFRFTDITDFKTGMRFDTDIASVSDSKYFEDFAVGSDQTSVTFLERRADLLYYDDIWRVRGELQNFQTIDIIGAHTTCVPPASTVPPAYCDLRPYSRVPRIEANALVARAGHATRTCARQRDRQFPARCRSDGRARRTWRPSFGGRAADRAISSSLPWATTSRSTI